MRTYLSPTALLILCEDADLLTLSTQKTADLNATDLDSVLRGDLF